MKFYAIALAVAFCFAGHTSLGQNKPEKKDRSGEKAKTIQQDETSDEPVMKQEVPPPHPDNNKVEISVSELPEEVHMEVRDNYHNGEIIRAYKLMDNGEVSGYVAEVRNGPQKWTLEFDESGNTLNKIIPNE